MTSAIHPSSFRDPEGFLFERNGQLFRQINQSYKNNYDLFLSSGLYKELIKQELLIPHEETQEQAFSKNFTYKVIKPDKLPFISYPHEWSFSQLKSAALLTLKIQKVALEHGMSLKDASAYNVQFVGYKPIFIDTLSFNQYSKNKPWIAYKQFCQHFLAPLALMAYTDMRLNQLFRVYMDGIPLDLTSSLLPMGSKFNPSLFMHIHMHSKSQNHFSKKQKSFKEAKVSLFQLKAIISNLVSIIEKLKYKDFSTQWGNYYDDTNYSPESFQHKKELVNSFLDKIDEKKIIWDFGANIGVFSRIASEKADLTVAFDYDNLAVEKNYLKSCQDKEENLISLCLDLTNPSAAFGWGHQERASLLARAPVSAIIALALIHHLTLTNKVSFNMTARFFSQMSQNLIIEFVAKEDSQVQKLLSYLEYDFPDYNESNFENDFQEHYQIRESVQITNSCRTIYLMESKSF